MALTDDVRSRSRGGHWNFNQISWFFRSAWLRARQGLIAGGGVSQRNHVHFAPYEPKDGRVISGMRCLATCGALRRAPTLRLQLRGLRGDWIRVEFRCQVAIYIDLPGAIQAGAL